MPVVLAASRCHIPAIIHESDLTPGLANRIAIPKATKVCCNFPETLAHVPEEKAVLTGTPIRAELLSGDASRAFALCNFTDSAKPTLLVVGGSSGSRAINTAIRDLLPELIKNYNVIHLCGKGNVDASLNAIAGYAQFEYANEVVRTNNGHESACSKCFTAWLTAGCEMASCSAASVMLWEQTSSRLA